MPKDVDFLVVGSGIAGLTFAHKAAKHGKVKLLTKKRKADTNTNYAQGGIAAVFGGDDRFENHIADTIAAGEGLCHRDAVEIMVREGPNLIRELNDMGCRFSVGPDGRFDLGQEGGHSRRRIVHAKDFTGQEIERVLLEEARKNGVEISENEIVLDLVIKDGECAGIYYFDADTQKIDCLLASATAFATGGVGQVYVHTTNPPIATGDGIAIAFRAGAEIANMEFMQFHPTAVYNINIEGRSFLISEAVRGEGGILKNRDGAAFMARYHPLANLAPRDIVARACLMEMTKTESPFVFLDVTHLKPDFVKNRFPTIFETCYRWGIDITREQIPVVPAAHYMCGGIRVDTWSESTIPRLFALGECSCTGVHGANRLASNSLLEALVFAARAAEKVKGIKPRVPGKISIPVPADKGPDIKMAIKELTSRCAGVMRSEPVLASALSEIQDLGRGFPEGTNIINAESRNLAEVSRLIIRSCLKRKESRGLHYLNEYPHKDDAFLNDTVIVPEKDRPAG